MSDCEFDLDGGFLDEDAAFEDEPRSDIEDDDPNVERPTPVHPSLFDRLRPLNALCEEPLSQGELENIPLRHFLRYLLRELPGRTYLPTYLTQLLPSISSKSS